MRRADASSTLLRLRGSGPARYKATFAQLSVFIGMDPVGAGQDWPPLLQGSAAMTVSELIY